ncbi:23S rRNA (uracil(1939)-C(5))-methyltransferase RlmD [Vibrio nomapromontoriensis]|uniref:23S rRNA (uracil(1939)-C(5))-methyltransferase RlmD n=1 Tax=Vibrio nomapromontoriensis TaxID=2910246 RepID=UPI003D10F84F
MARFFKPTKQTAFSKKHQEMVIARLDHHGAGIAYQNKKPVFIEGALPDETVLVQLTETKSKYSKANLIKVIKPSAQRVKPLCPHYEACGGCTQQHLSLDDQRQYKQQALSQLMSKFAGQQLSLSDSVIGAGTGYRRRARLSLYADKVKGHLQMGFRRKQSKQLVEIDGCPVLDSQLNALIPEFRALLTSFQHPHTLGHLELVMADNGPVAVLRHMQPLTEGDEQRLLQLAKTHDLTLYLMPESGVLNRVHGDVAQYRETGVTLPFLPTHFIQVNQNINQEMVAQALSWLAPTKQERVLDLFCGLGNFTLPLAKLSQQVVGVEGIQDMVDWATNNAALNKLDNVEFYQANLEEALTNSPWAEQKFDAILLDPARAGATGVIDQVSGLGATRVLYVSCNPATLARDSQSLIAQGYTLKKLGMMDMFPQTSHLESMALFEK